LDSPFAQKELMDQESEVRELGKFLSDVAKEMRSYNKGLKITISSAVALAEKMRGAEVLRNQESERSSDDRSREPGLVQLEPVFQVFADVLYEVAAAQEILSDSLETSFIAPVENFFKTETPKVAEIRKRLNVTTEAHEVALGRYLRPPAYAVAATTEEASAQNKKPAAGLRGLLGLTPGTAAQTASHSPGLDGNGSSVGGSTHSSTKSVSEREKRAVDVASTLRDYELARFNLTYKLNELEARKTFELSECVVASLHCFKTCFHHSLDTVATLEPFTDELQAKQQAMRERFAQAKQPWEVRRQKLNEVLWSSVASASNVGYGGNDRSSGSSRSGRSSSTSPPPMSLPSSCPQPSPPLPPNLANSALTGCDEVHGFDLGATIVRLSALLDERPAPNRSLGVVREGFLFMRTTVRLRVVWVRRWFILDGTSLAFVKGPEYAHEPATPVSDMLLSTVRDIGTSGGCGSGGGGNSEPVMLFAFELFSANRSSQMLQASSADDLLSWTTALRDCIEKKLVRSGAPAQSGVGSACASQTSAEATTPQREKGFSPARQRRLSQTAHPPPPLNTATSGRVNGAPHEHSQKKTKLQEILAIAGNETCADCAEVDPEWVSINLGVVLCIECSGIHRGLGTHVSKVRSLTLDRLGEPTVALLRRLGNSAVNEVFEHSVQEGWSKPGFPSSQQSSDGNCSEDASPSLSSPTRAAREQWIRSKYVYKGFASYDDAVASAVSTASATIALFVAARSDDVKGCMAALAHGADINTLHEEGCGGDDGGGDGEKVGLGRGSALHHAAVHGFGDVVEFLLLNGADCRLCSVPVVCTNKEGESVGKTPLDLAEAHGHSVVVKSLRSWSDIS